MCYIIKDKNVNTNLFNSVFMILLIGVIVNGLLHFFLPMIERRFELISTEAGLMTGAYDIASGICLIPVTYYGGQRRAHRPHYIGTGVIIMGTGSLIFSLPAFMAGPYKQYGFHEICVLGMEHPPVEVIVNNFFISIS